MNAFRPGSDFRGKLAVAILVIGGGTYVGIILFQVVRFFGQMIF